MSFAFFLEMAWKSAAIAGTALLLVTLLRTRSAADRAAVLRIAVALLLLLPVVSLLFPALQIELMPASPEPSPVAPVVLSPAQAVEMAALAASPAPYGAEGPFMGDVLDDPSLLIALLYLGGLMMAGARLLAGLWTLRRWTGAARPVECPEWTSAFERVRATAADGSGIRLLVSDEAISPLSWGWRKPVILIDPDTLDRPEDAEAILEHEIAHLIRRDWPALMLARAASILFWFNPLVLLLERSFVQNAEEAADCHAAERVEPAYYAQTLLGCAQHACRSAVPANSIAGSNGIGRRVRAILDARLRATPSGSKWTLAAIVATVAFAAPLAALELTEAKAPDAPTPPAAPSAPAAPVAHAAVAVPAAAPQAPAPAATPPAPAAPQVADEEAFMTEEEAKGVARVADRALASVLPQIPAIVASAMSAIDPEEIGRVAEEAAREAQRAAGESSARASATARATADEASLAVIRAQRAAERAQREAARAQQQARRSMAAGADQMERGADDMERGARQMEQEADRLRSAEYREEQIAKAARRGETLTHERLLAMIPQFRKGAQDMVKGAQEMRRGAAEMRRQGSR